MIQFPWLSNSLAYAALLLLASSTVAKHSAGLFWLALLVMAMAYCMPRTRVNATTASEPVADPLRDVAKVWLYCCAGALFLKTIPMVYWSGPWQERHAEFKLLFGAWACYLLIRSPKWPHNWGVGVGHALAVACVLSFALSAIWGSLAAPTYRIAWAAGVSIVACVLLTWSFLTPRYAFAWRVCSLVAVFAVLVSGVRGSYQLALIWPATWWWMGRRCGPAPWKSRFTIWALALLVLASVAAFMPRVESPVERAKLVMAELGLTSQNSSVDVNSSSGARTVLWKAGLQSIHEHPILGVGFKGGKEVIQQAAAQSHSQEVMRLGHFHNDYIHTTVEFGLGGLLSFLTYCAGIAWCAWRFYKAGCKAASTGLVAVLLMHMSASMSNMNFAHNFYPTMLSLGVSLLLLSPQLMRQR